MYLPRIQRRADAPCGWLAITGRRLSTVESAVSGCHPHVPPGDRWPRHSSQWRSPSDVDTNGAPVIGDASVERTTRFGLAGSSVMSPV